MIRMIAFVLGIFSAIQLPGLPATLTGVLLLGVLIAALALRCYTVAAFFSGLIYCLLHASLVLSHRLPVDYEQVDLLARGRITGLPQYFDNRVRFQFVIDSLEDERGRLIQSPGRVLLGWYTGRIKLQPDERWQLSVRMKRPHGFSNPGGFDYERWLFMQRINATGYVRQSGKNRRLESPRFSFDRVRVQLIDRLHEFSSDQSAAGIIIALATGHRGFLAEEDRDKLVRTGTAHLLAISGLHIGIVAAWFYVIGRYLSSACYCLVHRRPAQHIGCLIALLAAWLYSALAGFSVPTQRAFIMLAVASVFILSRRQTEPMRVLLVALVVVLLFDPFALLSAAFCLSFVAVFIILYTLTGRQRQTKTLWQSWGHIQFILSLAPMPVVIFWFQGASLVSLPVNLILVPYVSFLLVPLVLLTTVFSLLHFRLAEFLYLLAEKCAQFLELILDFFTRLSFSWFSIHAVSFHVVLMAMVGMLLMFVPRGLPLRLTGVVWILPLFFIDHPRPDPGEMQLTVLDVGQGLSAIIQTHSSTLLFDTGARFSQRFNAGEAIVVPVLRQLGIQHLDTMIISHGDNDHVGGASAVLKQISTRRVLSGEMNLPLATSIQPCRAGQNWMRDQVQFEILHPKDRIYADNNNRSCVVKISTGDQSFLLTGDIESVAEGELVRRYGEQLRSSAMTVPHHGSNTSSSPSFLDHVRPALAINSAGFRNRYGFPKQAIMSRYQQRGIRVLETAKLGAITIRSGPQGLQVDSHRQSRPRLWHKNL